MELETIQAKGPVYAAPLALYPRRSCFSWFTFVTKRRTQHRDTSQHLMVKPHYS